jgi:hypothetical protein
MNDDILILNFKEMSATVELLHFQDYLVFKSVVNISSKW